MTQALTPCPVCGHDREPRFTAEVLKKYEAQFVLCRGCDLVSAADPHWLSEAYSSPMSDIDTGALGRNWMLSRQIGGLLGAWFGDGPRFVDLAGGDGVLVRLMRDLGLDYYWDDPYTTNRFARGFEFDLGDSYAAATAIEVLEHVVDPLAFLRAAFADTRARAVVTTTTLYEGEVPAPDWWYYQFETGQHISFMTHRTLRVLAGELGCRLHSRGGLHVFAQPELSALPFRLATSRLCERQFKRVSRGWVSKTVSDSEMMKSL